MFLALVDVTEASDTDSLRWNGGGRAAVGDDGGSW